MPLHSRCHAQDQRADRGRRARRRRRGAEACCAQGASVDARDGRGRTALLAATHGNRVEAARLLIAAGADVNAKDAIEDSPFSMPARKAATRSCRMTLAAGADLKSTNRYGGTALIPAAHHGHVETVKILLATAIDKDHVNKLGWTALLEAVILGDGGPRAYGDRAAAGGRRRQREYCRPRRRDRRSPMPAGAALPPSTRILEAAGGAELDSAGHRRVLHCRGRAEPISLLRQGIPVCA